MVHLLKNVKRKMKKKELAKKRKEIENLPTGKLKLEE